MEMKFSVGFGYYKTYTNYSKLSLPVIAILLAAALHSMITEMA